MERKWKAQGGRTFFFCRN